MDEDPLAQWLFQWWLDRPWWIRVGCGALVTLAGVAEIYFLVVKSATGKRAILSGVVLIGWGLVLMLVGGKSDSERNGYHF